MKPGVKRVLKEIIVMVEELTDEGQKNYYNYIKEISSTFTEEYIEKVDFMKANLIFLRLYREKIN